MYQIARRAFGAIGLVLVSLACQSQPVSTFTDADRAAIDATTDAALAISNETGDWVEYVNTYYAPDAVVMPPNTTMVEGREAIIAFLQSFPPISDFRSETIHMEGAGDIAYVHGTYSMFLMVPGSEEPVSDVGKFMEVWKRQPDGGWKVAFDIFNSDLPAQ